MPVLAPLFREINYSRITQLDEAGMSPQTIVSIIRDETDSEVKLTPADIRSYLKIQNVASEQMLITKPTMKEVLERPPLESQPE
ncbi:hypothetical protein C4K06_6162 [Pseudomonas chlororaphis subsp. aureofaciens]|uniref:hypothetical protein n=1 Tax=Pseudomonas chlororaphis TaxID=587753 RepID=UPI000F55DE81|nr:hypothetical protein [Pseudomonas chlororaphis]AZE39150.1 hypothetical protein C4K06_6162 [Pseudomonas chlororaphis subsp. aureofaciens]